MSVSYKKNSKTYAHLLHIYIYYEVTTCTQCFFYNVEFYHHENMYWAREHRPQVFNVSSLQHSSTEALTNIKYTSKQTSDRICSSTSLSSMCSITVQRNIKYVQYDIVVVCKASLNNI